MVFLSLIYLRFQCSCNTIDKRSLKSSYAIADSDNNSLSLTNLCSDYARPEFISIVGFAEIFFCSHKSPKESIQLSIYFIYVLVSIQVFHSFGYDPFLVLTSSSNTDWYQGSSCNGKKRHRHNRPAASSKSKTKSSKSKSSTKTPKAESG